MTLEEIARRLTFQEDGHRYWWDGVEVDHLTGILADEYVKDLRGIPMQVLDDAAVRGTNVHAITQFYDEGQLDHDSVDPSLQGYFDAWRRFMSEKLYVWTHIEQMMFSPTYRFACRVDRIGTADEGKTTAIVEIKSGMENRADGPQTAAQALCARELGIANPSKRIRVSLRSNGTYRETRFDEPSDQQAFLAALYLNRWKRVNP